MAKTKNTYTGDGATTIYPVDFELGYIKEAYVYVYEGEDPTYETQLGYTWLNSTQIELDSPQTNGVDFFIRRVVERDELENSFVNGSVLKEKNLDNSYSQSLMILQEIQDGFVSTTGATEVQGDVTVQGAVDVYGTVNTHGGGVSTEGGDIDVGGGDVNNVGTVNTDTLVVNGVPVTAENAATTTASAVTVDPTDTVTVGTDVQSVLEELGTASTKDTQTSDTDTTLDRVVMTGALGDNGGPIFTTGNLNTRVFGGIGAGDRIMSGLAFATTVLDCYVDASFLNVPTLQSVTSTFTLKDKVGAVIATGLGASDISVLSVSSNKVLIFRVSNVTVVIGTDYFLESEAAASEIVVSG